MYTKRLIRVVKWVTLALLLLALYLASAPLAFFWCSKHFQQAIPVLVKVYGPSSVYLTNPDWPGSGTYRAYTDWCRREFYLRFEYVPDSERALAESSQIAFQGTPLRDVAVHLSQLHNCPLQLTQDTKWDSEITRQATATLREHLEQITQPLRLSFAGIGEHIVIGPPASVDRLISESTARTDAITQRYSLMALASLLSGTVLLAVLWRRSGRRQMNSALPDSQIQGRPDAACSQLD
jgi:hypothetical protein